MDLKAQVILFTSGVAVFCGITIGDEAHLWFHFNEVRFMLVVIMAIACLVAGYSGYFGLLEKNNNKGFWSIFHWSAPVIGVFGGSVLYGIVVGPMVRIGEQVEPDRRYPEVLEALGPNAWFDPWLLLLVIGTAPLGHAMYEPLKAWLERTAGKVES